MKEKFAIKAVSFLEKLELEDLDKLEPEAKMLLKQAAGRLIRSRSDRGRVAILDGRVLGRPEWKIPSALPKVKYRRLVVARSAVAPSGGV